MVPSQPPPFVAALPAAQVSSGEPVVPAVDVQRPPIDQCLGHFVPGGAQDALESRPGDSHALRCLSLIQPLEIFESNRFELFPKQPDLRITAGAFCVLSGRAKVIALGDVIHHAPFVRPWHGEPP